MARSDSDSLVSLLEERQRRMGEQQPDADPTLSTGGGGGGTYDRMEARITQLEKDAQDVKLRLASIDAKMATKDDLSAIRADVGEIKGMLKAMPTTLQLLGFVVAIFIAAGVTRIFLP
ncbi:hypothetical protein [Antarcticirhabdus aurantiaca]|uniref:hypothetical protein n=1 Tax=Antarcticirhabdus aurantiaca TaxID=2606717 RepID=UPI00131C7013|nr:hypothetical protein [Antarcticirhabdus aurantiaca]